MGCTLGVVPGRRALHSAALWAQQALACAHGQVAMWKRLAVCVCVSAVRMLFVVCADLVCGVRSHRTRSCEVREVTRAGSHPGVFFDFRSMNGVTSSHTSHTKPVTIG